jgi:TRAP-type C4-dicarboxylate transport system substrate-binding protein
MNRTVRLILWRGLLFAVMMSFIFTFFNRTAFAADAKEKGQSQISWKFANLEPPSSVFTKAFEWWADEIGRRTQGKLTVKVYSSGILAREKSVIEAVRVGLADAGEVVSVLSPGRTPIATVGQNPIGSSDLYVNHKAMQDLLNHYPPIQEEFKTFNQRAFWTQATGSQRVLAKRAVRTPGDFKGLKIRASAQMAELYKKFDATPVFIPMTEAYEGLLRGTADSVSAGLLHMESIRFHEVCKHLLMLEGIGVNNAGFGTVNLDRWNSLTPDLQDIVLKVSNDFPAHLAREMMESEKKTIENFKASGVTLYTLSPSDIKKLQTVGEEVTQLWVAEMEGKGILAKAALKFLQEAEIKYRRDVETNGYPWARK